ncbi:MAG: HAMP domain-containing protein [Candidatus Aenigmarchaeota archaeon]|nr:HAMP domain-containing protein [Candidatus Aenigmarchaeota archaeon]
MIMSLILLTGFVVILVTSKMLGTALEQNLIEREKIGVLVLEETIAPYIFEGDCASITRVLLEQKRIKKDILEYILVYDANNNILAHTHLMDSPEEVLQLHVHADDEESFAVIKHRRGDINLIDVVYTIRDETRLVGHIHVGYKKTYVESIVSQIVTVLIFVIILVSLFTGILGFFASDVIARPLRKLSKGMQEISRGNLDIKLDIKTDDELESLGNAFNKMAKDLKESQQEHKKHGAELESCVEARTSELNEKIDEMQKAKKAILNMMNDTEELNKKLIQAQNRLNRNVKELKETDIKKNQFMSVAAHELKTPMTSIHGFSQILQNKNIAKNPKKREKYLKIIEQETVRLVKIVNDFLDLSRVDMGVANLEISKVDVASLADAVRTEMAVQVKEAGLKFEYDIEKSLPKIYTDQERLTQVLINLINNAIKYTPKGTITLRVLKEQKGLRFVIKDTGLGITKENQDKIFSRFYQVDSSYTRSAGGVGLGLSLCKEFVELLGGKIWCVSTSGKGSEFQFTLPLKFKPAILKVKE